MKFGVMLLGDCNKVCFIVPAFAAPWNNVMIIKVLLIPVGNREHPAIGKVCLVECPVVCAADVVFNITDVH